MQARVCYCYCMVHTSNRDAETVTGEERGGKGNHAVCQSVARATCFERTVCAPHRPILYCHAAVRCFEQPLHNRGDISRPPTETVARAARARESLAVHSCCPSRELLYARLLTPPSRLADPPKGFHSWRHTRRRRRRRRMRRNITILSHIDKYIHNV